MRFDIKTEGLKKSDADVDKELPYFTDIRPDTEKINEVADTYSDYENIIIIGNGGSITSFRAFYYSFLPETDKHVRIVTTMEPDYLHRISREFDSDKTLVIPISKSGSTTGVIEALLYFMDRDYDVIPVTSDNNGTLRSIVEKRDLDYVEHKDVGGRFSGLTETGLFPAAVVGLDVEEIRKGAEKMYRDLEEDNKAYKLASKLNNAQEKGYSNILNAVYSTRLFGFKPLLVQLIHESSCKQGQGATVLGDLGPEYQHHTNQRLFGGKTDMMPLFIRSEANEARKINISDDLKNIGIRGRSLEDLDGINLSKSLESEYKGVQEALETKNIPYISLSLNNQSYRAIGEITAFIQVLAVYFARFQGVNPLNQPDVEKSKENGFEARFR